MGFVAWRLVVDLVGVMLRWCYGHCHSCHYCLSLSLSLSLSLLLLLFLLLLFFVFCFSVLLLVLWFVGVMVCWCYDGVWNQLV